MRRRAAASQLASSPLVAVSTQPSTAPPTRSPGIPSALLSAGSTKWGGRRPPATYIPCPWPTAANFLIQPRCQPHDSPMSSNPDHQPSTPDPSRHFRSTISRQPLDPTITVGPLLGPRLRPPTLVINLRRQPPSDTAVDPCPHAHAVSTEPRAGAPTRALPQHRPCTHRVQNPSTSTAMPTPHTHALDRHT